MSSPTAAPNPAIAAARKAGVPIGASVLVIRLFDSPGREVPRALHPPFPHWMKQLYVLERLGDAHLDIEAGDIPLSAAVNATSSRLHHRLSLIGWLVGALAESGWECVLVDDHVIAYRIITPAGAREQLERDGLDGGMTSVCYLDEHGLPLLLEAHQLRGS